MKRKWRSTKRNSTTRNSAPVDPAFHETITLSCAVEEANCCILARQDVLFEYNKWRKVWISPQDFTFTVPTDATLSHITFGALPPKELDYHVKLWKGDTCTLASLELDAWSMEIQFRLAALRHAL